MSGYIHPDIMALFTDDASRGVHSKNNVCAYRDECRANDAEIERLRAELAERDWQPIETAPCDDTWVLMFAPGANGRPCTQVIDCDHDSTPEWWRERGYTHWMPLPKEPKP